MSEIIPRSMTGARDSALRAPATDTRGPGGRIGTLPRAPLGAQELARVVDEPGGRLRVPAAELDVPLGEPHLGDPAVEHRRSVEQRAEAYPRAALLVELEDHPAAGPRMQRHELSAISVQLSAL